MMRRARDADPFVGDNIDIFIRGVGEAMARIDAQVHFMMPIGDIECLGQLSRARAKPAFILNAASSFHQLDSVQRLHRAN